MIGVGCTKVYNWRMTKSGIKKITQSTPVNQVLTVQLCAHCIPSSLSVNVYYMCARHANISKSSNDHFNTAKTQPAEQQFVFCWKSRTTRISDFRKHNTYTLEVVLNAMTIFFLIMRVLNNSHK